MKLLARKDKLPLVVSIALLAFTGCGQDSGHSILDASSNVAYQDQVLVRGTAYDLAPTVSLGRNAQAPASAAYQSVGGPLPSGLTFDTISGHISGIPLVLQPAAAYGASFTDSLGQSVSNAFKISVIERWTDADNAVAGLRHGTMLGVGYDTDTNVLRMNTNANYSSLDADWTPRWDRVKAYYKMDGDWTDSSGNANDGATGGGAPTWNPISKVGTHAGSFNGSSFVAVPSSASLAFTSQLSVMTWIYISSSSANFWLFSKNPAGFATGFGVAFEHPTGKVWPHLGIGGALRNPKSRGVTAYNQWNQVVVTYDGAFIKTYLNGVLDTATAQTGAIGVNSSALQIGNAPGSPTEYLNGKIDELAIWDVALSDDEIRTIYARQVPQASGYFTSRVFDAQATTAWPGIRWKTVRPSGKPLVGDVNQDGVMDTLDQESAAGYDGLTSSLTDGLRGLWHLDEAFAGAGGQGKDLRDSSAAGRWLSGQGTTLLGLPGILNLAAQYDGTAGYSSATDVGLPTGAGARTLSVWVKPTVLPGSGTATAIAAWGTTSPSQAYGIELKNVAGTQTVNTFGQADDASVNFTLPRFVWSHVVATFDGTTARTYVNGAFVGSSAHPSWNTVASGNFVLGRGLAGANYFTGSIDEVAVWSRALDATDVLNLYRRGANRMSVQVRSCGDAACATGSPAWVGPVGTSSVYFDETYNSSGNVKATDALANAPRLPFTNFGATVPAAIPASRYFQYRLFMESDDRNTLCTYAGVATTCSPELRSVYLGPDF